MIKIQIGTVIEGKGAEGSIDISMRALDHCCAIEALEALFKHIVDRVKANEAEHVKEPVKEEAAG